MVKEYKKESVTRIEQDLSNCTIAIVTDYRGIPVSELGKLRRQLKESHIDYHIVKNTLAAIAAERTGNEALRELLKGPSAIAFGRGEATDPAKILTEYIRSTKSTLSIKGGILNRRLLTAEQVMALSLLPPREALLAQLVGQLQSPISSLVFVLSAQMRGLLQVLEARKQQLEGG
jgi:large subunit ribosomal protein L10